MRSSRTFQTFAALAVTLITTAGLASPASAASTVDVTYNLSDTTLEGVWAGINILPVSNADTVNGTLSGSMKVQYASNSQSSMPIQTGAASLLSLNLTVSTFTIGRFNESGTKGAYYPFLPYMSGNLHWQLTGGPLAGNLTSGGALTGLAGGIKLTGTAKCLLPAPYSFYCGFFVGIPAGVTAQISRSYTGPFNLAGSVGPNGGAQSTRHTLSGSGPISFVQGQFLLSNGATHNGYGGAQIVGREVLREAAGHPPKVIPEPGTLLLLGAGTAGLAFVGRATRRSRRS